MSASYRTPFICGLTLGVGLLAAGCMGTPGAPQSTTPGSLATMTPAPNEPASDAPSVSPTSLIGAPDLAGRFDVGGHELYIECRGTSGPVVVLETGTGSPGGTWLLSDFVAFLDRPSRRCVYDRANLGASDKVKGPRTSATAAEELHALLGAAGLPGPYVLVGRSFGGYNVRLFAAMYPAEVAALVLVETLTPEFHAGMKELLDPSQWASEVAFINYVEFPLDIFASGPLVAAARLPAVPLLVVSGTKWHGGNEPWPHGWPAAALDALWLEGQEALAASVPNGTLVVYAGGDHSLFISQPERLAGDINTFVASVLDP
jgi:pimeloyl-ACP methyl ester carboxylesterase